MQARHRQAVHSDPRQPLRLNAVDWAIYGIVVVSIFGGRALSCSGVGRFQQCMRDGMPGIIGVALQAGVLVVAVWTGSGIGQARKSTGLGLACGALIFLLLSSLLGWLGLAPYFG